MQAKPAGESSSESMWAWVTSASSPMADAIESETRTRCRALLTFLDVPHHGKTNRASVFGHQSPIAGQSGGARGVTGGWPRVCAGRLVCRYPAEAQQRTALENLRR